MDREAPAVACVYEESQIIAAHRDLDWEELVAATSDVRLAPEDVTEAEQVDELCEAIRDRTELTLEDVYKFLEAPLSIIFNSSSETLRRRAASSLARLRSMT